MQVKLCDNFYNNDTNKEVLVTYEIQCEPDERALEVEIVDQDGNRSDGCSVPQGKTEEHSFWFRPEASFIAGVVRATAPGRGRRTPHCVWGVCGLLAPIFRGSP